MQRCRHTFLQIGLVLVVVLSGCGKSGSRAPEPGSAPAPLPTTISGTVAAGAPLNGTLRVRDSAGVDRSVTIGANGVYTIDLAGLIPPFVFEVQGLISGKAASLYSAATADDFGGTVNVTPLTTVIVANILGSDPAINGLANAVTHASSITTAALQSQGQSLHTRLADLLVGVGLSAPVDVRTLSFTADHSGLDAALDLTSVSFGGNTITIQFHGSATSSITNDLTSGSYSGNLPVASIAADKQALDEIVTFFTNYNSLFTRPGNPIDGDASDRSPEEVLQFGASNGFWHQGTGLNDWADEIAQGSNNGVVFDRLVVLSVNTEVTPHTARVRYTVIHPSFEDFVEEADLVRNGTPATVNSTAWRKLGDKDPYIGLELQSFVKKFERRDIGSTIVAETKFQKGLTLDLASSRAPGVAKLRVTGPGLPDAGLLFVANSTNDTFELPNVDPACTAQASGFYCLIENRGGGNFYVIYDSAEPDENRRSAQAAKIAEMADNVAYTIAFLDSADNPVPPPGNANATATRWVARGPGAEQPPESLFPSLTEATINSFVSMSGAMNFVWTVPANSGVRLDLIGVVYFTAANELVIAPAGPLAFGATTYAFSPASTPDSAKYHAVQIFGDDIFARRIFYKSIVGGAGSA